METLTRTVTITDTIHVINKQGAKRKNWYVIDVTTGDMHESFFTPKSIWKQWKSEHQKNMFDAIEDFPDKDKYYYLKTAFWKTSTEKEIALSGPYNVWQRNYVESTKAIQLGNFNPDRLIRCDWDRHMFYTPRNTFPLSRMYYINYIGGICNDKYDLAKAMKILTQSQYVYDPEYIDIPWYNASESRDQAIIFFVKIPQKDHDIIFSGLREYLSDAPGPMDMIRAIINIGYMQNAFKGSKFNPNKILNLAPARITNK